jgi:tetratricopeptide (TPR) repeat protein
MNDNTRRIVLVVLTVIILSSIILPLVAAKFEEAKGIVNLQHSKTLWLSLIIIRFLIMFIMILWLVCTFYNDWMRERLDRIEQAARMKIVVSVFWWLTITLLVLLGLEFLIILYRGSHRIVFASIESVLLIILVSCFLPFAWDNLQYFRKRPLCNIVAACLREQSGKFLHTHDFDKAYAALIKASEISPDETELWCRLAFFCELIRKDTTEADKFIAKAGELITTKKDGDSSDKACYLNYLGTILYGRGECEKGLEYVKQSIDIGPNPGRINSYEKMLSEWREKQKEQGSNAE